MGSTKRLLPNDLSLEDLINTAESEEKAQESTIEYDDDIVSFLLAFDIRQGTHAVSVKLFYNLYKKWSKAPVKKAKFDREVANFLIRHQKGPNVFYLIDKDVFKVSEEIQKFILNGRIDKTKSKPYKKHFDNFLKKYELKAGTYYIESYILFFLYDRWAYSINKKNSLSSAQFFNFCKLYFPFKRNSESRVMWFGIQKEGLLRMADSATILEIRKGRQQRYGKAKQKDKAKVSGN